MKKIVLVFLTAFLVSGCPDIGSETTFIYTVENESGVSIEIRGGRRNSSFTSPIITRMAIGEKITKKKRTAGRYGFYYFFGSYDNSRKNSIDSLVVIYNNERRTSFIWSYSCLTDTLANRNRNPLSCGYNRKDREIFTFTAEDYENATPCNGDCE